MTSPGSRSVRVPVTEDRRLLADLELLRVALASWLGRLRHLWTAGGEDGNAAQVERLLAAAGRRPEPDDEQRAAAAAIVEEGRADRHGALAGLCAALDLGLGEELLVAASWWCEADPAVAVLFGCAHDDGAQRYPSSSLLRLLLDPFGVDVAPVLDDGGVLVRAGVLMAGATASGPLRLTPTAHEVLAGTRVRPALAPPPPARHAAALEALSRHLRTGRPGTVVVRGPQGIGRRRLCVAAALAAGVVPVDADRPGPELALLARLGLAVPVANAEAAELLTWPPHEGRLLVVAPPSHRPPPGAHVVDLAVADRAERAAHWRAALAAVGVDDALAPAAALAARFAFTDSDIDAVAARLAVEAAWSGMAPDTDRVWAAARRQPEHALQRVAALIVPVFGFDDLVLAPEAMAQLREVVAHVALQDVVLDGWGFRRRLPRGHGVAALFTGPPGTGKTMAAEAVAAALHQDLYRVDLAAVVSKYVGETEKNLGSAFDEAERAGAVLFFDEADALFGRRTEVRDAHDRYANLEVNYLLQRVECFSGLVVLASNRRSAIDEAFLRRLRFVIRFDMPDRERRAALWRRSFPAEAACEGLDWQSLAAGELAGGSIQQVALHAAFRAAGNGGVITSEHVAAALGREYAKLGKAWAGLGTPPEER